MTYLREDMYLVTIDGDPTPWCKTRGGAIVGGRRRAIEDLTLERIRRDDATRPLVQLSKRVGDHATVTFDHLDANAQRTGNGVVYEGTILAVHPAGYDANGYDVALDRVVLKPTRFYALGDQHNACRVGY